VKSKADIKAGFINRTNFSFMEAVNLERRQITTTIQSEVNHKTAVELGRIGVNLNQLQRAMNTSAALRYHLIQLPLHFFRDSLLKVRRNQALIK
jgi:hypothetical protein